MLYHYITSVQVEKGRQSDDSKLAKRNAILKQIYNIFQVSLTDIIIKEE